MNETRKYLNQYAMLLGTYMGVFWIAKFCLVPSAITNTFLMLLFIGLTLCVPFMGYYYTRLYRDRITGGTLSFMHAWLFGTSMYIYASLLTAVAHYVYFSFLDNGYMVDSYMGMLNQLKAEQLPGTEDYIGQLRDALEVVATMKPIDLTIQQMSNNMFYGMILSAIVALFVRRKAPQQPTTKEG